MRRAKQHDAGGLTFFIDECIKCSLIVDALNQLATKRERVHVAPKGTLDEDWLRDAGMAGWVCFSRDRRMLIRPNELNAILYYKVALFTVGVGTGAEHARLIADALPLVRRAARDLKRAFVLASSRTRISRCSSSVASGCRTPAECGVSRASADILLSLNPSAVGAPATRARPC